MADCDVHNKGAGTVTIGTQTVVTGSHAHISNDGAWVVVVGGGSSAELTKEAIEAVLTGEILSHSHAGSGVVYYEPLVNGDPTSPEIMFDDDGDIIMVEV